MIGILSDAHGNIAGFEKGMRLLESRGARRFLFLGDAVGYIPRWDVVDALWERRDEFTCILGNHEEMLLNDEGGRDHIYLHAPLRETITKDRANFLASWPRSATLAFAWGDVLLVHGSPTDTQNGYLYPDTPLENVSVKQDLVLCGHTHRPFSRQAGAIRFVNVGSCGLPRDDGRFGSVALLDESNGDVSVLRYDIEHETRSLLHGVDNIHASVSTVLARRSDDIFGEV